MRKVLLATTALVALGGVTTASADISVSASASWWYDSWSDDATDAAGSGNNNTSMASDGDFKISGSTVTDSGMEFGGHQAIDNGVDDDVVFYVSDDWGKLEFGEANGAAKSATAGSSSFDAALSGTNGQVTGAITTGLQTATVAGGESAGSIKYTSPLVSGIQIAISKSDAGGLSTADRTEYGATYAMNAGDAAITLSYGHAAVDAANSAAATLETESTSFGAKIVYGDFTVRAASMDSDSLRTDGAVGTGYKSSTSEYGVTYTMSPNLTLEAVSLSSDLDASSAAGADTYEASQIGAKYTVATGMYVSATSRSFEFVDAGGSTDTDGTAVRLKVGVTF